MSVLCYSNIYSWSMRSDRECKYKTTEKKQVLQHDVVLVQKQPVIETESYGAENIRDTKRFYPILEGMYIWDMRVRVSFQKKTIRKEKLVTR